MNKLKRMLTQDAILDGLFTIIFVLFVIWIFSICSCNKVIDIPNERSIVITIDDAPNQPLNTKKMLNVLNKHNAQAIFFCIGYYIETDTMSLTDSIAKYHTLSNHTYSHPDIKTKSLNEIYINEIEYTQMIIDGYNDKYNKHNAYFRPPYGSITDYQQDSLTAKGYNIVWWDIDASDWNQSVSVNEILSYHKREILKRDKSTLIFHLSDNSIIAMDSLLIWCDNNNIKYK